MDTPSESSSLPRESSPKSPLCYDCVHRLDVPGSAHSRCNNFEAKVTASPRGVQGGWFRWPLNFDPVWLQSCDGFSDDPAAKKPRREASPLAELFGLLG